ncbi:GNAT family N-acetyltransferase [Achromobacter xylosoxidans]
MLIGDIVSLTEVRAADSELLYKWINSSITVRFNSSYRPVPLPCHSAWFDNIGKDRSKVLFAIRRHPDGPAIGTVQLIDINAIHRSAELTIRIGEEADRGKGVGTEALSLALDFAARDLNLQRIWLRVFESNKRAQRAYEKAGFRVEGVMRRAAWIDGKWENELIMAWLKI